MRVVRVLSSVLIGLVGGIHLLPVSGVLSAERLQALYGIAFEGTDLLILMRHRAVLFGIVGGVLIVSALRPRLRPIGVTVGLVSMLSFVCIAVLVGDPNPELTRVAVVDGVASLMLVGSTILDRVAGRGEP
jgi:hypothetical protein